MSALLSPMSHSNLSGNLRRTQSDRRLAKYVLNGHVIICVLPWIDWTDEQQIGLWLDICPTNRYYEINQIF